MTGEQVWFLRHVGRLTIEEASRLCGVSPRTWRRYEHGETTIPPGLALLLKVCAGGALPTDSSSWAGWRMFRGELYSPEGLAFRPGDIRSMPYLHALVAELRAQLRRPSLDINPWANGNVIPFPRRE